MPSSPESPTLPQLRPAHPVATGWRLEELRAGAGSGAGSGPRARAPISAAPLFEVAGGAAVPEDLLAEARAAAEAAGYAAGWAHGAQQARRIAVAEAEAARREREQIEATQRAQVHRAVATLADAATALEHQAVPGAEQVQTLIVESAFAIAEMLVGRALADDPTHGAAAVRRALALAPDGEEVTVRISPVDHQALTAAGAEPINTTGNRIVYLVADPALQSGDVIASCGATTVDARVAAGLERVRDVLRV